MKREENSNIDVIISEDDNAQKDIFNNIKYICKSTELITRNLENGCDVAQMPNGDVIVTEIKAFHTLYSWNAAKCKMVKVLQKAE